MDSSKRQTSTASPAEPGELPIVLAAAERARDTIANAFEFLRLFPFACRKATPESPLIREMMIGFGRAGYVALYEIESDDIVTVLAVRHQREDDFY